MQSIQDLDYVISFAKAHLFIKTNGINVYLWGEKEILKSLNMELRLTKIFGIF